MFDPTTNYCGAYYSDGKIQPSVYDGLSQPINELDELCRAHDAVYAHSNKMGRLAGARSRIAADNKFYEAATYNTGGIRGPIYGFLVKNFNIHMPGLKGVVNDADVYDADGEFKSDLFTVDQRTIDRRNPAFKQQLEEHRKQYISGNEPPKGNGSRNVDDSQGSTASRRNATSDANPMIMAEYRQWHKQNRPERKKSVYFDEYFPTINSKKKKKKQKNKDPPQTKQKSKTNKNLFQEFEKWLKARKVLAGN